MGIAGLAPFLPHDAPAKQLQAGCRLGGFPRRAGLHTQDVEARFDLRPQVFEPEQVGGELVEPLHRLLAALLDPAYLRRLFQQLAALGGRAHDDLLDVVLADDRVRVDGQAGGREHVEEIAPADTRPVQEVVTLAVSLDAPLDGNLVVVHREAAFGVVEHKRDLGESRAGPALASDVDDLSHRLATEVACLAGPQDPLDRVHDVRLAGAVGTDDRRDAAFESDLGRPGKSLEAQQAQRTEEQGALKVADVGVDSAPGTTCGKSLLEGFAELTAPCLRGENNGWFGFGLANRL